MTLIYEVVGVESICRLCLRPETSLSPIFQESDTDSIASKISACVGFEIHQHEDLPSRVCSKCVEKVKHWNVFRNACQESNKTLMRALKGIKIVSLPEQEKIFEKGSTNQEKLEDLLGSNDTFELVVGEDDSCVEENSNLEESNADHWLSPSHTTKYTLEVCQNQKDTVNAAVMPAVTSPQKSLLYVPTVFKEEHQQNSVDSSGDVYHEDESEEIDNCDTDERTDEIVDDGELPWRQKPTACPICGKSFGRFSGVKLHLKVVHTILKLYPCLICAHISCSSSDRKNHISEKHPENSLRPYTCRTCGICVKSKSAFSRHNRHHEADLCCDFCGLVLDSEEALIDHKKTNHSEEMNQEPPSGVDYNFHCHLCENVSFWRMKDWKEHYLDVHKTQDMYPCNFCSRAYRSAQLRDIHSRNHTGEKPYMCDQCATRFTSKGSLRNHMRKHTTRFQCTVCLSSFSSRPTLIYHMRCHTGEKPYVCHECGKRFASINGLQIHILAHKGEKPYSCKYCDYKSSAASGLYSHRVIHTAERPFACEVCGKTFKLKAWMKEHMKTHTGVKNFVCEVCNHAFIAKYQLKSHMKTHTGDRPHKCEICCKGFSRKDTLTEHVRTHTKETKYSCNFCKKEFMFLKPFKNHTCVKSLFSEINLISSLSEDNDI